MVISLLIAIGLKTVLVINGIIIIIETKIANKLIISLLLLLSNSSLSFNCFPLKR